MKRTWLVHSVELERGLAAVALAAALLAGGSLCGSCSDGGASAGLDSGPPDRQAPRPADGDARGASALGTELEKPGGGTFFLDPHQSGNAAAMNIAETTWGRLVDIHDVSAQGVENPTPRFRDFVVNENIQSDGSDYSLLTHPATKRVRLVIHAKKGSARFGDLLAATTQGLPVIVPKNDDGTSAPPFSLAPRNACLVVRLDDCLDDGALAAQSLNQTVRMFTGLPPTTPFAARILFDPNHGGLVRGEFHSTRVLVDFTVSEFEASTLPVPQPLNHVGLPAGVSTSTGPSASLHIPTVVDVGSGQFEILRNLAGNPLFAPPGPVLPPRDVVRALRAGGPADPNNGFLLDFQPPRLLGSLPVTVDRALPAGGQELLVDLTFSSPCLAPPTKEDVLSAGGVLLEVLEPALVGPQGKVEKLRVRSAAPLDPATLLGLAALVTPFAPDRLATTPAPCWVSFTPPPPSAVHQPGTGVSSLAEVRVSFDEPIDPASLQALDSFLVVRGAAQTSSTASPTSIVLGQVQPSVTLEGFAFSPSLPLAHTLGVADPYHVELGEVRDLAGNALADRLPFADFRLDANEPTQANGSIVLRFGSSDEIGPDGLIDVRGQFFFDFDRGALLPRPVAFTSWPVDRSKPVPSIMIPFAPGVQTPLNPLGSKLQAVWRYCDLGWNVRDETKYNVDVEGLNWAPLGGVVVTDFFEQFEIRLAHSRFLPDESIDQFLLPKWTSSGLLGRNRLFTDNILVDPLSPQTVVHPKGLGYTIRPADRFQSSSGTTMLPYPLNQGSGPVATYTWRDTAVLAKVGPNNQGIPMDIETGPPLFLEPQAGTLASAGNVPSFGLPLLMEFRCYPSSTGIGLNALDVSLAINSSPLPAFRAYSSGGINTLGNPVTVDPDTSLLPTGGFDPTSIPPGQPTLLAAENVFAIGQLDTVTRVSRAHTIWLDTGVADPGYSDALVAPLASALPQGTQIRLDYRGATGFSSTLGAQLDGTRIDAYGDLATGTPAFLNGVRTWTDAIADLDGARHLQVRITFLNNVATGTSPELSLLGIPFVSN